MGLIDEVGRGPVAIDTSVLIYFVEENPRYLDLVLPLFQAADLGALALVTSAISLLEVLVLPLRQGDVPLAERYEVLLTQSRGITVCALDLPQLRAAAQLRARYRVRTPDAIQLAAAVTAGCSAFVTNDRRLAAIETIRVVRLDDYVD